jgi:protein tyrosine phosphatase
LDWYELKGLTQAKYREVGAPQQTDCNRETDRYLDTLPFVYNRWHETNGSTIAFPFSGINRSPASPQYVAMCAPPTRPGALKVIRALCNDKIPVVLTLTAHTPGKADPYMPQVKGESIDLGEDLFLNCTKKQSVSFEMFAGVEKSYSFTQGDEVVHTFAEIQITNWEDMTGGNASSLITLMNRVDRTSTGGAPIVVSCSAGVGRTGTFIVAHQIKQHVERKEPFKVNELLLELRMQREGAVQKPGQYATLFEVANELTQT